MKYAIIILITMLAPFALVAMDDDTMQYDYDNDGSIDLENTIRNASDEQVTQDISENDIEDEDSIKTPYYDDENLFADEDNELLNNNDLSNDDYNDEDYLHYNIENAGEDEENELSQYNDTNKALEIQEMNPESDIIDIDDSMI